MTDLRKAAEMALEALESWQKTCLDCGRASDELGRATAPIQALRQALADEAMAHVWGQKKKEWVGLSDEEIDEIYMHEGQEDVVLLAQAKLKEKNT